MKDCRIEIGAARPDQGVDLGVYRDLGENRRIA
jgi:hypothetical protein